MVTTQRPFFALELTLGLLHPMGVDKHVTTWIHSWSVVKSLFSVLKVLYITLPTTPVLATTDAFTVCTTLPLPEHHLLEITHSVAFSDQLVSRSEINALTDHPYLFYGPSSSVLLYHWILFQLSGSTVVYLSIQLLGNILVSSKFRPCSLETLETATCGFLCGYKFAAPLGNYSGVWLLESTIFVTSYAREDSGLSSWIPKQWYASGMTTHLAKLGFQIQWRCVCQRD